MCNQITVYKQIYPSQCQSIAKLGYKSLINLRFDDECANQPIHSELLRSAQSAHLNYRHLPVHGDDIHLDTAYHFARLIDELPKPIMVFCGTGGRAKRLYQCAKIAGFL